METTTTDEAGTCVPLEPDPISHQTVETAYTKNSAADTSGDSRRVFGWRLEPE